MLHRYIQFHCQHKNRFLPKGGKKVIDLMKDELGGKTIKDFVRLRAKTYNYLINDYSEDEKVKCTKKCVVKRKLKLKDYKKCLKATQLENQINQLEKNEVNTERFRENHNEFIKNNKLIFKTQWIFKSKKRNVFTEEVNKIVVSANDDKK